MNDFMQPSDGKIKVYHLCYEMIGLRKEDFRPYYKYVNTDSLDLFHDYEGDIILADKAQGIAKAYEIFQKASKFVIDCYDEEEAILQEQYDNMKKQQEQLPSDIYTDVNRYLYHETAALAKRIASTKEEREDCQKLIDCHARYRDKFEEFLCDPEVGLLIFPLNEPDLVRFSMFLYEKTLELTPEIAIAFSDKIKDEYGLNKEEGIER